MTIQYIIIAVIVGACIIYILRRTSKTAKGEDCSCSCSGCHKQCGMRICDTPEANDDKDTTPESYENKGDSKE